jgi:hypothetical protein
MKNFPALVAYALNVVLALVVSFGVVSTTQAHVVLTVATALAGLVTVFLHKPVQIPVAATLFSTVLVAIGGFGMHLSSAKVAALTAAFSMLAAWFTHQQSVPSALVAEVPAKFSHPSAR